MNITRNKGFKTLKKYWKPILLIVLIVLIVLLLLLFFPINCNGVFYYKGIRGCNDLLIEGVKNSCKTLRCEGGRADGWDPPLINKMSDYMDNMTDEDRDALVGCMDDDGNFCNNSDCSGLTFKNGGSIQNLCEILNELDGVGYRSDSGNNAAEKCLNNKWKKYKGPKGESLFESKWNSSPSSPYKDINSLFSTIPTVREKMYHDNDELLKGMVERINFICEKFKPGKCQNGQYSNYMTNLINHCYAHYNSTPPSPARAGPDAGSADDQVIE